MGGDKSNHNEGCGLYLEKNFGAVNLEVSLLKVDEVVEKVKAITR